MPDSYLTEFPLDPNISYLNHAAVAPWPQRTAAAVQVFAQQNTQQGAKDYPRWLAKEQQLRQALQSLINAPSSDEIALLKNTSEGLSIIAYGLDWQPGDRILIAKDEFPSNRIVWESLASQGVQVQQIDLACEDPEAAFIQQMDAKTRLISVSSVHYSSGLMLDLSRLGQACRQRNILFCIDAIQSLGACPLDVQACEADFVVADGHKWMLGPEGLALFYFRRPLLDPLKLYQYGWHMIAHAGDYDRQDWQPAASAKRFECGSPNMLGIYALEASLSLLLEIGLDTVYQELQQRTDYLKQRLQALPNIRLLPPIAQRPSSGIVLFTPLEQDPNTLYRSLMSQQVICAYRGGGVRFSPHFYTPYSALDLAIERLTQLL